jgi:hypothetical protein
MEEPQLISREGQQLMLEQPAGLPLRDWCAVPRDAAARLCGRPPSLGTPLF